MLLMGKPTISMAIFNSYVKLPEGISSAELSFFVLVSRTTHSILRGLEFLNFPFQQPSGLPLVPEQTRGVWRNWEPRQN